MKNLILIFFFIMGMFATSYGQITGQVVSATDNQPLESVYVLSDLGKTLTYTDNQGRFSIAGYSGNKLIFTHLGSKTDTLTLSESQRTLIVYLFPLANALAEVVISTGYQQVKERHATGSFTTIGEDIINRSTSPGILGRLENLTNSLTFIRKDAVGEAEVKPEIRIRGRNTIHGSGDPLIILDNFPYEGDINNINPNDIESVTLLKDAAASSIWGARAGNGVLVITTKKGKFNQALQVTFNANVTIGQNPDLFYSPYYMSSGDFIDVEKKLFAQGFYTAENWTTLSPVVEAMIGSDTTSFSRLRAIDYRHEAEKLFYRNSIQQQYAVNLKGGSDNYRFYVSGGYNSDSKTLVGNNADRYTLQSNFNFKPFQKLRINLGTTTIFKEEHNNGIGVYSLPAAGKQAVLPYTRFKDQNGTPLAIPRNYRQTYLAEAELSDLLNWEYVPLNEQRLNNRMSRLTENRIDFGIDYQVLPSVLMELKYQNQQIQRNYTTNHDVTSYYVRDLVNRFTQPNNTRVIPAGNIMQGEGSNIKSNSLRLQANFNKILGTSHYLNALMGTELREVVDQSVPSYLLYGVDNDILIGRTNLNYGTSYVTRPRGVATIPAPQARQSLLTNRYLSYYANLNYIFREKYSLTASGRQDGANLYGIKVNQRFVPLWSVGAAWILNREAFFPENSKVTHLKLRATFGYSGNTITSVTAYPTATYSSSYETGLPIAFLRTPGNPALQWEKIATRNFGLDFSIGQNNLSGSLDFYTKHGLDLLGDNIMEPTTGLGFEPIQGSILANRTNYANTKTSGIDFEITKRLSRGEVSNSVTFLANYNRSIITEYRGVNAPNILSYTANLGAIPPVQGNPTDPLYSLPWSGLNPIDGSPLVSMDGQLNSDYSQYINGMTIEQLVMSGSTVPTFTSSVRNTFNWRAWSISFTISLKAGYFFRAGSIDYYNLFNSWQGHEDYTNRWQKTGDEVKTQVPSMPSLAQYDASGRRDLVYSQSEVLVEKGNHLRWSDLNLSYTVNRSSSFLNGLKLFFYAQNLGILWTANSRRLDPDYPNSLYPAPPSYSIGLTSNF